MASASCETCRFWKHSGTHDEARGLCRRHAPHPPFLPQSHEDADREWIPMWPVTYADIDWCGEYRKIGGAGK